MKKENTPLSLKTIAKETPFTVPDGYFEQFAINIDAQIAPKRIVRPLNRWIYAAAMFTGVMVIGIMSYTLYKNNTTQVPLITEDDYDNLINAGVSEDLLVEYILNE